MMANITFLSFLMFSMCHSIQVAVNTWLNCSFFTLIYSMFNVLCYLENEFVSSCSLCLGFWGFASRPRLPGLTARPLYSTGDGVSQTARPPVPTLPPNFGYTLRSVTAELLVIQRRLKTSFDGNFLVLPARRRQRSEIAHFLSTGSAPSVCAILPLSVASASSCFIGTLRFSNSSRAPSRSCLVPGRGERAAKLMRQFNDG